MKEYDKETIKYFLNCLDFNINDEKIDLIKHIPIQAYAIATEDKPLLCTFGLQCCIGLYAWAPGFGYLAHIDTVAKKEEYYADTQGKPIKCRRTEELYTIIANRAPILQQPIKIGLSLGIAPLKIDHPLRQLIYRGVQEIIQNLAKLGIKAYQAEDLHESDFVLDSRTGEIITPEEREHKNVQ